MYGRRDQVQAHSFLADRLVSAVLRTDPDAVERPLRRTSAGLLGGLAVGALVLGVVAVVALVTGRGSDKWQQPGTLAVDSATGTRYLLVDGRLRPVLNFASARLLLGGDMKTASVSADDLAKKPKGAPIGIPGAPDVVPARSAAQPWTVCAGTDGRPAVTLTIGTFDGAIPAGDQAVLVRAGDGAVHLAWQGRRFRAAESWVPRALGLDPGTAVPVPAAWLNALPAGPDLGSPKIQRGGPGPALGGRPTTAGQLVTVPDAVGATTYVVARNGLMPVTALVAALVAADPDASDAAAVKITPAQLATQQILSAPPGQGDLPATPPALLRTDGRTVCVRWADDRSEVVTTSPPRGTGLGADPAGVTRDARTADRVDVSPGAGLLARTRPAPGVPGDAIYLITETGAKFPVANADAAAALGLPADSAQPVPADLLALLPTGPVLHRIT